MIELRPEHLQSWREHRFCVLRAALSPTERAALLAAVEELAAWPETPGRWMKYFEPADAQGERRLCRVEDFLPWHAGLRGFMDRPDLLAALQRLLGEPPVLFKEKINYKLPGGGGFAAHQDAPAFTSFDQRFHVTLLASVDPSTEENGCLQMVRGWAARPEQPLPQNPDGTIADDVVDSLQWRPLTTEPGDLVFFDSYVPHRSGTNRSAGPRRALYITWNRASEGDRRADYYQAKRAAFPPECERDPDAPLSPDAARFNLGNPIR